MIFFSKLMQTLEKVNVNAVKPQTSQVDINYETYSQAYQGFAQNNVSKIEGFSVDVQSNDAYQKLINELILKKQQSDQSCQNQQVSGNK
jgi:hypothetical protein